MNSPSEFLIERSDGRLWSFFYKQNGLHYRVRDGRGRWDEDVRLLENAMDNFSVDIDTFDNLHLVCINQQGELLYFMHNGAHWYNKGLATFPVEKYRLKYISISAWKKYLNIFFAVNPVNNPGLWSIQHNFWNGTKWTNFRVVRVTGDDHFGPFYTGYDHTGSLHLVYKAPRLGVYQLSYCKFRPEYLVWSNPETIAAAGGNNCCPYTLTDDKDTLHLVYSCPVKNNPQIRYVQKSRISNPRGVWKNESVVFSGSYDSGWPLIYIIGNSLWTVWVQKDALHCSFSHDQGRNWSAPLQVDIPLNSRTRVYQIAFDRNKHPDITVKLALGIEKGDDIILPVIADAITDKPKDREIQTVEKDSLIDGEKIREYAVGAKDYLGKLMEEVGRVEDKKVEIEKTISIQAGDMAKTYKDIEDIKKEMDELGIQLEHLKKENLSIISDINDWEIRYKEHRQAFEEIDGKYAELSVRVNALAGKSIVQRVLDFFR